MRILRVCSCPLEGAQDCVDIRTLSDKFVHLGIAQYNPEVIVLDFSGMEDVPIKCGAELQEMYRGRKVVFEGLTDCDVPLDRIKDILPDSIPKGRVIKFILRGYTVKRAFEGGLFDDEK